VIVACSGLVGAAREVHAKRVKIARRRLEVVCKTLTIPRKRSMALPVLKFVLKSG
jgi:hypothetical protein